MPVRRSRVLGTSRRRRATLALLLTGAMLLASGPRAESTEESQEHEASMGAKVFDAAIVRPFGALALVVGCIFFAASAPFVAPFEGIQESLDTFVYPPYEYAFVRGLGEF